MEARAQARVDGMLWHTAARLASCLDVVPSRLLDQQDWGQIASASLTQSESQRSQQQKLSVSQTLERQLGSTPAQSGPSGPPSLQKP
jgi:hypothetical protein